MTALAFSLSPFRLSWADACREIKALSARSFALDVRGVSKVTKSVDCVEYRKLDPLSPRSRMANANTDEFLWPICHSSVVVDSHK